MKHTELQPFFKERLIELLHKDTLDSYRVRTHNAFSLLKELKELICGWKKNRIKQFETVQLCIQETIDMIENDTNLTFSSYDKSLLLQDMDDFSKTGEKNVLKANRLIFALSKCIIDNSSSYLKNIFNSIEQVLFNDEEFADNNFIPKSQELDNHITALCCELINIGYSKIHLYVYVIQTCEKEDDFRTLFNKFKDKFLGHTQKQYTVIFKLYISDKTLKELAIPELSENIEDRYLNDYARRKFSKFIQSNKSIRFYTQGICSLDSISAIKKGKELLLNLLDQLHLGMCSLNITIPDKALVVTTERDNTLIYERGTQFLLDGSYSDDIALSTRFREHLNKIKLNMNIKQEVKDRLDSAMRHLRIGNNNEELEQRFINYWIALEFIFSSPETNENTYTRLKTNLINILTCCYVKRNILSLNEQLIQKEKISAGMLYWRQDKLDEFIDNEENLLLRYRLLKIKSHLFGHSDKRKIYIENHEKNLNRHLARIYRMRNELIHEAAIKQNIENITSNLRYYLVFVLNQLIVFFATYSSNGVIDMEDFFYEYEFKKKMIRKDWDFNQLVEMQLEMDLLK